MADITLPIRLGAAVLVLLAAFLLGGPMALGAGLLAAAFTQVAMPLFRRYAIARPNARSSHVTPVPQGGGAAVVLAALLAVAFAGPALGSDGRLAAVAVGALVLAVVGAVDDIRGVAVLPRLGLQFLAVALVVLGASGQPFLPLVPYPLEVMLLIVAGVWFVNLTNFMDGIDGITLAGFLPLAAGAALLGYGGRMSPGGTVLALCFFGALAGFVAFNLPRAKIFLGDVGSLPIGLLGGALAMDLAQNGALAAAVILPLYHFTDATLTLLKRLRAGEKVWEPHRHHAYQNAVDGGWSHGRVSGMVLLLNAALAGLAVVAVDMPGVAQMLCVGAALAAALGLITVFRRQAPAR